MSDNWTEYDNGEIIPYLVSLRGGDGLSGALLGVQEERIRKVFLIRVNMRLAYRRSY